MTSPDAPVVKPTTDRIPGWLREAHARLEAVLPATGRRRLAATVGLVAAIIAVTISASRLLILIADTLDILAYAGLFVTNFVANGGLLVPVPGLRLVGWLMIIQQGGALDAGVAGVIGGVAMALGQTSLYVAGASAREGAQRHHAAEPSRLRSITSGERAQAMRDRLERLLHTHGFATVVGVSLLPTPLTTVAAGMAGAMGYGFRRFVLASLIGRIALGLVLAYLGDAIIGVVAPGLRSS
jgi:membrane protein DedA with SNARE-associated domain